MSVLMQSPSYPTKNVLSNKINRHIIFISLKGSPRKPSGLRPVDYRVSVALLGPSQVLCRYEDRRGWMDVLDDVPQGRVGENRLDSKSLKCFESYRTLVGK